jgi:hypothetical protein
MLSFSAQRQAEEVKEKGGEEKQLKDSMKKKELQAHGRNANSTLHKKQLLIAFCCCCCCWRG